MKKDLDDDKVKKGYKKYEAQAKEYLKDKDKAKELLANTRDKMKNNKGKLGEVWNKLELLVEMLKAWLRGDYQVNKRTIVVVIATLLYFVSPIDLIPDFIAGLGFFDDAAVIAFAVKQIAKDLEEFEDWKNSEPVIDQDDEKLQ